jgi:hypothetical protein
MGLDMYLTARCFVPRHEVVTRRKADDVLNLFPEVDISKVDDYSGVVDVRHLGYWRKANAIHRYFVDEVWGGADECNRFEVDRLHLERLRDLCKAVLTVPESAEEKLPTQDGFFFGSTEYGEGYRMDLTRTIEIIYQALVLPPEWSFYYRGSW